MPEIADQLQIVRSLRETNASLEAEVEALKFGDGGGTFGGVTEDWKTSVDRQLDQLHKDVRALLRWGSGAVVALALMIGGLYLRTDAKFDGISQRLTAIEVQQAKSSADTGAKIDLLLERTAPKK